MEGEAVYFFWGDLYFWTCHRSSLFPVSIAFGENIWCKGQACILLHCVPVAARLNLTESVGLTSFWNWSESLRLEISTEKWQVTGIGNLRIISKIFSVTDRKIRWPRLRPWSCRAITVDLWTELAWSLSGVYYLLRYRTGERALLHKLTYIYGDPRRALLSLYFATFCTHR